MISNLVLRVLASFMGRPYNVCTPLHGGTPMDSCHLFDWDDHNEKHLAAHCISPTEAEQVFANAHILFDHDLEAGEPRWTAVGITNSGRLLVIVFTVRGEATRPITGWDAEDETSQLYFEQMGN